MLVVKIELWPHGDESRARVLGRAEIANDGSGTRTRGNYVVRLFRDMTTQTEWRSAIVTGFPRLRLGAFDLLFRALVNTVGNRR